MTEPAFYQIKNWAQFQHYKDRNPAWIKMHFALLASEDWVMLPDASKLLAVVCMLVASRHDGRVPNKPAYLKRIAYLDQEPDLGPLIECGFLSEPLAESSSPLAVDTERLSREEERREEGEKKEGRVAPTEFAFIGKVIRLKVSDFTKWASAYDGIPDLTAELTKADDYYSEHPPPDGKWFFPVSRWLAKAHAEATKPTADPDERIYRGVL